MYLRLVSMYQKWGLAAHSSKAIEEARGKFALFWMPATKVRAVSCPKSPSSCQSMGKSFYRLGAVGVAACGNSTVISDQHLEIGHQWAGKCHLDYFRYS